MKFYQKKPPRVFRPSKDSKVELTDHGKIHLEPDEQVSFVTDSGKEYDFTAKSWGFYISPSINGRLLKEGYHTALVRNRVGKYYVVAVDKEKIEEFNLYLEKYNYKLMEWLNERK